MAEAKDPKVVNRAQSAAQDRVTRGARSRLIISGMVLAAFWGALLYDYWPALLPAALRLFNSARSVGAQTLESPYFEVHNNSAASEDQVRSLVKTLEQQYKAIRAYTQTKPAGKLQVLLVDGSGPALVDGSQMVISYDNGLMDIDLAPLYLAVLIQGIPVDLTGGLVPGGGQSLQVVEAAGLGDGLIRQPLDAWTVLLRQSNAYVPLEEAWIVTMPNNDDGYYLLMRAMLESGSFMGWFSTQYGLDAAQRVARGEGVDAASGKSFGENEAEWLQWLDQQKIQPQACDAAIPQETLFRLICRKLDEAYNRPINHST